MNDDDFFNKDIWTVQETARYLRVHRTTVNRLVNEGKLPSHRIGTRQLLKKIEVIEFFDNLSSRGGYCLE